MEANHVLNILKYLKGAYGNRFEINDNTPTVWYDVLKHTDYETVMSYIRMHATEKEFPPSLADLKRSVGETDEQRYHQDLKVSAQNIFAALDEWEKKAVPPPSGTRERVMEFCRTTSPTVSSPSNL